MKTNIIKLLSFALAALMLAGILCACRDSGLDLKKMSDPERADMIVDLSRKDPDDTYMTEMEMNISGSLYGVEFEAEYKGAEYSIGLESDSPVSHSEIKSTVKFPSNADLQPQITESAQGFRDGKLYQKEKKNGKGTALCSDMTYEEYKAYTASFSEHTEEEILAALKTASVKESVQGEDGSWSATHSGFAEKELEILLDSAFDPSVKMTDGYRVKDISVTTLLSAELIPTEIKYELTFEPAEGSEGFPEPSASAYARLKEIGSAQAPDVVLSEYKETEHLPLLRKVREAISDLREAEKIAFTSKNTQRIAFMGNTQETAETDTVKASSDNDKYTFEIRALLYPGTSNETIAYWIYKDGKYRISGQGITTQSGEMTDTEAKLKIAGMLDPGELGSTLVSDIRKGTDSDEYIFTIADPDISAFESAYSSMGAKNFKAQAEITVKYTEGSITEYTYGFVLTAEIEGQTLTATINATISDIEK